MGVSGELFIIFQLKNILEMAVASSLQVLLRCNPPVMEYKQWGKK